MKNVIHPVKNVLRLDTQSAPFVVTSTLFLQIVPYVRKDSLKTLIIIVQPVISLVKLVLVVGLESAFIVKFLISTTPIVLTAKERTLQMKFKDAQTPPKEQSLHLKILT